MRCQMNNYLFAELVYLFLSRTYPDKILLTIELNLLFLQITYFIDLLSAVLVSACRRIIEINMCNQKLKVELINGCFDNRDRLCNAIFPFHLGNQQIVKCNILENT